MFSSPGRFVAGTNPPAGIGDRITVAVLLGALFVAVLLGTLATLNLISPAPTPRVEVQLGCVIEHDIAPEDIDRPDRQQQLCP